MSDLTVNELMSVKENLHNELLMVKKYKLYAQVCDDPQLRQKCEQVASEHQDHYLRLLNQLC